MLLLSSSDTNLFVWIQDFCLWLTDIIQQLFDFASRFMNDLLNVINMTSKFALEIPSYLAWLPSEVQSVLAVAFAVVVTYKVLGREG